MRILAGLLVYSLLLGGCAARLFRPPVSIQDEGSFARRVPASLRTTEADLFYATDRAPRGESYGAERGLVVRLGVARVRFGHRGMTWEELARRSVEGQTVGLKLLAFREFGLLASTVPPAPGRTISEDGQEAFAEAVNAALAEGGDPTITVFVHGFNSSFHWGIYKAASLWHYSARRGVVITYSWPAYAHPFAYARDRESGWITSRGLRELLIMLAEKTDAERINVLTYSAGATVVTDALQQLRLLHAGEDPDQIQRETKLKEIVLAGPDESFAELQVCMLDGMQDVAQRLTIYTSRLDLGLWLSSFFYFNGPRLGWGDRGLTSRQQKSLLEMQGVSVIDVRRAQKLDGRGDIWAHAYWYGNSWVSSDVLRLLATGQNPPDRGLVGDGEAAWRFPSTYADLVGGPPPEPDETPAPKGPDLAQKHAGD